MKFKTISFSLIFSILLSLTACDSSDDSGQPIDPSPTTFEIISNSEDHTILEQALVDTGLDEVLNSGIYTVFAPNDDAFNAFDISGLSNEQITNILLYHVLNGNALASDFGNGYIKTNANTNNSSDIPGIVDMYVSVDGGITLNGQSNVIEQDIEASNGTVHVVDALIYLATIETLVSSNPNFSNLETALIQENLSAALATAPGDSPAPFTFFAPDNNAFDNFIAEGNGFDDVQSILDSPNLTDVLTYHLISGYAFYELDLQLFGSWPTLQGDDLSIESPLGLVIVDQNERSANITITDITASNGVIHLIDNLLLPTLP